MTDQANQTTPTPGPPQQDSAGPNPVPADPPAKSTAAPAADTAAEQTQVPAPQPAAPSPTEAGAAKGLASLRVKIGSLRDAGKKQKAKAQPASLAEKVAAAIQTAPKHIKPPSVREPLSPELEQELQKALGDCSLEELIEQADAGSDHQLIEPKTPMTGRVVSVRRDDVFVDLGGRNQGVLPKKQFAKVPPPDTVVDLVVNGFDPQEGLYAVSLPGAAVDVGDWSEVAEGMVVDVTVTEHNKGGLVCTLGSLRGFIPASQVGLYRVADLDPFIGQKFSCVVTEANRRKRNLVLSRRAVLERERAEAKEKLWESLAVGQIHEGVVRNLQAFGAFVDLGGVDGLIHISQLSWERVGHPSEVLEVGQKVQVRIDKLDPEKQRIGLAYRDLSESPWARAAEKYPASSRVQGTVAKIMDFGALVRLEPGVSGLVHISELSHKRIWRVSDVLEEGQEIEVLVQAVDPAAQRISLSLKALAPRPVEKKSAREEKPVPAEPDPVHGKRQRSSGKLKGGLDRAAGGQQFGLKW